MPYLILNCKLINNHVITQTVRMLFRVFISGSRGRVRCVYSRRSHRRRSGRGMVGSGACVSRHSSEVMWGVVLRYIYWGGRTVGEISFTQMAITDSTCRPPDCALQQVEQAMRDALYDNAKRAVNEYPQGREASIRREKWLWDYPAQVAYADASYSTCPDTLIAWCR